MKCNVCGAYNKPEYKKCIRCGNVLKNEEEAGKQEKILIEHQSPLKNTPTFREAVIVEEKKPENEVEKDIAPGTHKDAPEDADLWSGKKKKHHFHIRSKKQVTILSLKDESEASREEEPDEPTRRVKVTPRAPTGTNREKMSKLREGQEVEVILPPESRKKAPKTKKERKLNLKWGRLILVSVVAGVLIIGVVVGFIYLFRGIFSSASQLFAGHEGFPNDGKPLVERVLINGQTWHKITFYGEDGERVLIDDPIRSLSVQDNKAVLLLDDLSFIPEEDSQDESKPYVEVDLQASLFSKDGDETPLEVPAYKIEVPESPLKIVYPTDPNITVNYTQVLVKIKVNPGSRVKMDGTNLTDIVDSDGFVQKYVNLKEGENDIVVEVETTRHRRAVEHIYVTRPEQDVTIELDSPPSEHREDDIWITGYTDPDAEIIVDTLRLSAKVDYKGSVTIENDDGTEETYKAFEFRYVLSSYGWNDIVIDAVSTTKGSSTLIHRVNREPDHRKYTKQAWDVLDNYDWLSQSTSALVGKIFKCNGQVISREDTDTSRLYLFNVGTNEDVKYIMIEYSGRQQLEVGMTYEIYADVIDSYENYPLLAGRFIYDWSPDPVTEETPTTEETTEQP